MIQRIHRLIQGHAIEEVGYDLTSVWMRGKVAQKIHSSNTYCHFRYREPLNLSQSVLALAHVWRSMVRIVQTYLRSRRLLPGSLRGMANIFVDCCDVGV